ncbi:MAG: GNAT family N-acetyltransferase [Candidatus Bathyarchaeota archaeon]|nr:GNAT family N-acetyltransferase [Candidatus Bathyarchaeota archaeon]
MFTIEKVDESNKQRVIDFLRLEVIRHVFAFHDIQYELEHTTMYVAFENEKLKGYILIYTALEFPSVVLECDSNIAAKLIGYSPENHFIIHASPPNLLPVIERRFPDAKHYVEDWMMVKKGEASLFRSELVRRLCSKGDASNLAMLRSSREDRPRRNVKKYHDWISKMPVYGVFIGNELISYAGSFIQLPQVWMIGGVYTHPNHRNKGYATLAISAVTEEALKHAETAALFVRWDNYPAIRVYEKIGYKKLGEKLWVDVGAGIKP